VQTPPIFSIGVDHSWVLRGFRGKLTGVFALLCLALAPGQRAWSARLSAGATLAVRADALPDAPQPQTLGSIQGAVTNPAGTPVGGIRVMVVGGNLRTPQINITNRTGRFVFGHLAAGSYTVSVAGPEIEPVSPSRVVLGEGEVFRLPITVTPMPRVVSTVRVTASVAQVAKAQEKQEVQQRVLAVIPNFSTSFVWDAAPLTTKLKFRLELRALADPFTIFTDASLAGFEQYNDTYPGYGSGWPGYGKRFGASLADSFDSRILGDALLPSVFHQDPRYFYHGGPNLGRRFLYALDQSVMCRGDDKEQQFCYSRVLGDFAAAGISNVYHAQGDRGVGITVRDGLVILGANAAENVLREFVSRALTSHKPPGKKGKPRKH
jgi:hypothetical protein